MATAITPQSASTLFLRLEGPLQAWGDRAIGNRRRTLSVPSKSGVVGLLGAALGLSRTQLNQRLHQLNELAMAVRVDRAGSLLEDYHTVGARIGVLAADGKVKRTASTGEFEAVISPRQYLVDASFLVVLQGRPELIQELAAALQQPAWPLFLGRKRCVPGCHVYAGQADGLSLAEALRMDGPTDDSILPPDDSQQVRVVTDLIDLPTFQSVAAIANGNTAAAYEQAKTHLMDRLRHLEPPVHGGRVVLDFLMPRPSVSHTRPPLNDPLFGEPGPPPPKQAADPQAKKAKKAARDKAYNRCIFCRFAPADPQQLHAHHLTYVRRGRERVYPDPQSTVGDDLVMLCHHCHEAVTMLEYQLGFGLDRIDPRQPRWRQRILAAREAIRRHANPSYPAIELLPDPPSAGKEASVLYETLIPLEAGTAYPTDAPGNIWLANRHHVHQRLSMAFPEGHTPYAAAGYGVSRDEGGFLFRIEHGERVQLRVRSRIVPDWGRAFGNASWLVRQRIPRPRRLNCDTWSVGTELAFHLEANPVKRLRADGPEGRCNARVPLRSDDDLRQWLARQGQRGGFEVIEGSLRITRLGRQTATLRDAPARVWDAVEFAGRLRVTDSDAFGEVMTCGIGPAKAFGFGLLVIASD